MKVKILIGVMGVGKSTYIKNNITDKDLVLSSDELRIELFGTLASQLKEQHNFLFDEIHKRILKTIESNQYETIYYDATNLNRKKRSHLYREIRRQFNNVEIHAVCLLKPLKTCIEQNNKREGLRKIPIENIIEKYKTFTVPRINVDCDYIEKPYGNNINEFRHEFEQDLEHNSVHHKESIKEHINLVMNNCPKDLLDIAEYHDLGKNICKTFKSERTATYRNHEKVSAMYYLASIDTEDQEKLDNMEVILQHMNAHRGLSDKLIERDNLYPVLDKINRFSKIDNLSKIPYNKDEEIPLATKQHFNFKKGIWERCNAIKRKCPYSKYIKERE